MIKKQLPKKLKIPRERFLIICIMFLLLVIAYLLGRGNVFVIGEQQSLEPSATPAPTITLTPAPTLSPVPTIIEPTTTPTPNPIVQNRIKSIDERISKLKQSIQSTTKIIGESTECITLVCTQIRNQMYSDIRSYQQEIQQLEAEKTQLQLK